MTKPANSRARRTSEHARQRQTRDRTPQQVADVISGLIARHGYANEQGERELSESWRKVVGDEMGGDSTTGNLRRGVLEIVVRNSIVLQELAFRKRELIRNLVEQLPERNIRDIRFRVGNIG